MSGFFNDSRTPGDVDAPELGAANAETAVEKPAPGLDGTSFELKVVPKEPEVGEAASPGMTETTSVSPVASNVTNMLREKMSDIDQLPLEKEAALAQTAERVAKLTPQQLEAHAESLSLEGVGLPAAQHLVRRPTRAQLVLTGGPDESGGVRAKITASLMDMAKSRAA